MSLMNESSFLPQDVTWKGITLTEPAAKQLSKLFQQNVKIQGLRLSIKHSGCAGFGYVMDLVKNPSDKDLQFSQFGLKIFVPLQSMPFIDGTQIDYIREGLNEFFKFNNPKAYHTCGCGESFGVE